MSRFTFTLALAMVAVFAFGQRVTTQMNFAKNNSVFEFYPNAGFETKFQTFKIL